jgi:serine/threonine-protein kinase HipA
MGRKKAQAPLAVFLNARRVGTLARKSTGAIEFAYGEDWLAWEAAIPVSLSLPLREDRYTGATVLAVFDNLLPDSPMIRARLASHLGAGGTDPFSLLSATGRDCVGALQFLPEDADPGPAGTIDGRPVSKKDVAAIIRSLAASPLGLSDDDEFRISIAGAQEKTALLKHKGKWLVPHGSTPTTHILKPQIGITPDGFDLSQSVENEYFCMKLLAAMRLPVADVEIADFEDHRVLAVTRFDRTLTRDGRLLRLPQEDCCQALSVPWTLKYQKDGGPGISAILDLLKGSDTPDLDRETFFKAQIIFWALGATDGHAKNFSLHLLQGGRFRMTPLYDVLSAQPLFDAKQIQPRKMTMAMSAGDNRHYRVDEIMPRHFVQTGTKCGIDGRRTEALLQDVKVQGPKALDEVLAALPKDFPKAIASSISEAFLKRLEKIDGA